jgi:hypothetical protein
MTPPARWRPDGLPRSAFILGPSTCQGCGATVWFGRAKTRINGQIVLGEVKTWREWGRYAAHSHAPVKGLRRTLRPRPKTTPNPHPMLANARAAWDNRVTGSGRELE